MGSLVGDGTCQSDRCYPDPHCCSELGFSFSAAPSELHSKQSSSSQTHGLGGGRLKGKENKQIGHSAPAQGCNKTLHEDATPDFQEELEFIPNGFPALESNDIEAFSFSYTSWCNSLTRWVLKSRTAFGHYLSRTLCLLRDGPMSHPTALFPLPLPVDSPYAVGPKRSRSRSASQRAEDRALHVVISALNYLYYARSKPSLELIRRQPNKTQSDAIWNLRLLLRACDHSEPIQVASSGRKNLLLMARLQELALAAEALGLQSSPYTRGPKKHPVPPDNSKFPQLNPFSNLNPSRLKISGRGQWQAADFLDPEFYLAFQEPQSIELSTPVFERGLPNFGVDSADTVKQLFLKWDELDLLMLHPKSSITTGESGRVKIFNAFKSQQHDRQIGDRRERNGWEGRFKGPSSALPNGPLIGRLAIPPGFGVKLCVTDRSDYYHQIGVSAERSRTNIVWPPMKLSDLVETKAYQRYLQRASKQNHNKVKDRTVFGDNLADHRPEDLPTHESTEVYGGFRAILQGDHLGVELGISAHVGLLQEYGLLPDLGRLVTDRIVQPAPCYQGLCIDDFFAIAPVPIENIDYDKAPPSQAKLTFDAAKRCYADFGLAGSDAKDVVEASLGTVVGAEVDSRLATVSGGILPVGAPAAKRLALSWLTASAARFGHTTDALHASLLGGLVSAFCFRKCCMSILSELFLVIPPLELDTAKPQLRPLPRKAAEELILSSVLLPIAVSDIKSPFHEWTYASDASNFKGAYCEGKLLPDVAIALWNSGDFKGASIPLESWQKQVLRKSEKFEDTDWEQEEEYLFGIADPDEQQPGGGLSRPLAQYYDFIEFCGGSGVLSDYMSDLGYVVGPIIDLTFSLQYDLASSRVVEWAIFMVQNGRIRAVALEPPCTTFSPAAYPSCRSYKVPRGYNQKSRKVWLGNRLAFACMIIFLQCIFHAVFGLFETPRRSKMAWLQEWIRMLRYENVEETYTASCSYGSQHQKEFRFLTCNMKSKTICKPCSRDHKHVKIEGAFTKKSAVYCPGLVAALGDLFHKHLQVLSAFRRERDLKIDGLESPLVNEILKRTQWKVGSFWKWNGGSHINVLEMASAIQSIKKSIFRGAGRVSLLLDSNVCVRALAKGRSSSRALLSLLRKTAALSLAWGVFLATHFSPTRLNVSDDPTRDVPLREPCQGESFVDLLSPSELCRLAELPKLRRWSSNWISLVFGLASRHAFLFASIRLPNPRIRSTLPCADLYHHILDFDSTLGFPGEGPVGKVARVVWILLLVSWILTPVCHGMHPRHADDAKRAARRASLKLADGRPVQPLTQTNREKLLGTFKAWLEAKGTDSGKLFDEAYKDPEKLVKELVLYGRELFSAGRPYSHFSETINSVAAEKPTIRRLLTSAWDLAFSWIRQEPGHHHTACPFQILLALLSTAILWGWPRVAGAIALSWGAVCRIGEVLQACRRDLILPQDVGFSSTSVFLRVEEPKTRYKAARHQMSRLDYEDLVKLVSLAFGDLPNEGQLWPQSGQLLRTRFRQLLQALGLPTSQSHGEKPLDLGSLRAGGATFLLMVTEDAELVRRRGRWLAHRTMEVYLQEVSATVFFPRLPEAVKARVMTMAQAFPALLSHMQMMLQHKVPTSAWYEFSQTGTDGKSGKTQGLGTLDGNSASKPETIYRERHRKKRLSGWS